MEESSLEFHNGPSTSCAGIILYHEDLVTQPMEERGLEFHLGSATPCTDHDLNPPQHVWVSIPNPSEDHLGSNERHPLKEETS